MTVVRRSSYQGSSPHTRGAQELVYPFRDDCRIIPAYAGSTLGLDSPDHEGTDHPRIRGEHRLFGVIGGEDSGSSPHTRGAQGSRIPGGVLRRIIPAYAGSTTACHSQSGAGRDHPRIRGEHYDRLLYYDTDSGIIPAYAGSTMADERLPVGRPDHPRIRGEHRKMSSRRSTRRGSSPHTRGAPFGACAPLSIIADHPRIRGEHTVVITAPGRLVGIIPAYAGSTAAGASRASGPADHPRIRGEHVGFLFRVAVGNRIIPAYAGSTCTSRRLGAPRWDHPRIRGEHCQLPGDRDKVSGSSPHTRGARTPVTATSTWPRIIPAYAGSTAIVDFSITATGDHPRIRGEHAAPPGTILQTRGSSPHTRGARDDIVVRLVHVGIIPAYAGSTRF